MTVKQGLFNSLFYSLSSQDVPTRYFVSLFGNVTKMGLSFLSGLVIAHGLGPAGYGDFNFLLVSFVAIRQLLDVGTSQAFYTFISRKKRSFTFYSYYFGWLLLQFAVTLAFIWLICPESLKTRIWVSHSTNMIILAFVASFTMTQLWEFATSVGESVRDTFFVQLRNLALAAAYLLVLVVLMTTDRMSITNIYLTIIILYLIFSVAYMNKVRKMIFTQDEKPAFKDVFNEFRAYCSPLVIYTWFGFLYIFADNWFLQHFGGSTQQGFYSVGIRFCTISLIATTAMLRIFWKEISEATEHGDQIKIKKLYKKTSRTLYFVGAALSFFLIPFSKEILLWFLGPDFENAWIPLMLLFLFPLHQSLGQIAGTFYLATGRVRQYRNIGLAMMAVSLPVSYFVLANPDSLLPGLGLGALGLSLKMLVLQFFEINAKLYLISKILSVPFDWTYQFIGAGALFVSGFFSKAVAGAALPLMGVSKTPGIWLGLSGAIYSLLALSIILLMPYLIDSTREELMDKARGLRHLLSFR